MKDFRVFIRPFELLNLLDLKITKQINEHATATFSGCISQEISDEYIKMTISGEVWGQIVMIRAIERDDCPALLSALQGKSLIEKRDIPRALDLLNEHPIEHGAQMLAVLNDHQLIKKSDQQAVSSIVGAEQTIFKGVVTKFEIAVENGVKTVHCELKSGTYLMDTKAHIRTFQASAMLYETVLETIAAPYGSPFIMTVGHQAIDTLIAQ